MDARDYPEAYLEKDLESYGTRSHILDRAAKDLTKIRKQVSRITAQRDELLAALETIKKDDSHNPSLMVMIANEVIAKVKCGGAA